ncbi:COG4315 family predicted lipoprotein [Actinomadura monticuli]|uniref:Lipoprotein n=1 Tax=Actinomadura monticuli TaxID=3097367 RepID=A0ABV4QF21_9ACTN
MRGRRTVRLRAAFFAIPVMAVAGCAMATNTLHPGRAVIRTAQVPPLGQILVDGRGRTLYLFVADLPDQSSCDGACAAIWPPATTQGPPRAGGGAQQSQITTIARPQGPRQLVYAGHPLYYYQADTGRGDIRGQALSQFGAEWYAVSPQGRQVQDGVSGGSPLTDG